MNPRRNALADAASARSKFSAAVLVSLVCCGALLLAAFGCATSRSQSTRPSAGQPSPGGSSEGDRSPADSPQVVAVVEAPADAVFDLEREEREIRSLVALAREQARLGLLAESEATWDEAIGRLRPLSVLDSRHTGQLRALEAERERSLQALSEALSEALAEAQPTDPSAGLAGQILEGPEPALDPEHVQEVDEAAQQVEPDYPVIINDRVIAWIEAYTGHHRDFIAASLARSGAFVERFREIFAEEGIPQDLVYMAHVESGFKTSAYSRAHAKGIFQFISSTGRRYGLRVDWWVDERSDPERSCRAAAAYLRDLYAEFGDWYLALAAYNGGEGRVRRAIRRAGTKDFWTLAKRRFFRRETRNYVPAILAATLIAKNPHEFGFTNIAYEQPQPYDIVTVPTPTDLEVIARVSGADIATLRRLNPSLRRAQTPPGAPDYRVYVPAGFADGFDTKIAQVPEDERIVKQLHRVRRGDTLSAIARRYGTTVRAIQQANNMGRRTLLRIGQVLDVPRGPGVPVRYAGPVEIAGDGSYRVRRGDTLSSIARGLGVSVRQLQAWNGMGRSTRIYAGQRLRVSASDSSPSAPAGRAAARSSTASGSEGSRVHVVRRGDTPWGISRRYRVSLDDLLAANGLHLRSVLHPGQKVIIPDGARAARSSGGSGSSPTTYIVRRGDNLYRIAQRFGISLRSLCDVNNISPSTTIYPGDRLTIVR
ncbi:MAG: LysM peptidoglycan-binding domain-containing protein [Acidobacteriota bacterium]|nr:MAG: LysM peptidoglycan-binding domain-containing protein [Acidobacteriota bacterium]